MPVDPTAAYKPSEYALHLAHPDLQETIFAFKRSGRRALVIARSTLGWSSATSTFSGKFLDDPEFTFTQGRFRRESVTIAKALHHLAINDTVLILNAEESVEPVYERPACAIVDAGCITSRHMMIEGSNAYQWVFRSSALSCIVPLPPAAPSSFVT